MDDREERLVKNEALFREVNEQIDALNEAGPQIDSVPTVCECGSSGCTETLLVSRRAYEAVRAHPERFLIKPNHVFNEVEDVVERHPDWWVVAKKPGGPRRLAEATDPRQ